MPTIEKKNEVDRAMTQLHYQEEASKVPNLISSYILHTLHSTRHADQHETTQLQYQTGNSPGERYRPVGYIRALGDRQE